MSLRDKIEKGKFIITAELGPPQSANPDVIRKKADYFRKGVDAVNITDNQTAIVRMSSIASAKICLDQGLEPVVQMTCRDRNRLAIQSDLLGAAALGIENILCLTGDHMCFGNHPEARGVFDMDSIQLIATVRNLTEGFFLSGEPMKTPPRLFIGAAANPCGEPLEMRIIRLEKKIKSGAQFIQTQPVFDLEGFDHWLRAVRKRGLDKKTAILAGVMPVKSVKALEYMKMEVPGMKIADQMFQRMKKAKDPKEEGVQMAADIIRELRYREGIAGIHLMPLLWESITLHVLEKADLL